MLSAVGLAAAVAATATMVAGRQAPLHTADDKYRLPGRFLVALNPGTSENVRASLFSLIPGTTFLNTAANIPSYPEHITASVADQDFHSFTVHEERPYEVITGAFTDAILDKVRGHPSVMYVEEDQRVSHYDHEYDATWGLSRLSSHTMPKNYHLYGYAHPAGSGVTAYVIDTGIYTNHTDFEGRAKWGANFVTNDSDTDGNGHGTHVAGTIGGHKYGVAKKVDLMAVKVLDAQGSGTMSGVVKGVEWAIQHHKHRTSQLGRNAPSVANMSLGGGSSPTLDRAVNAAVKAGIAFAVAAGNDNADACGYSPAASDLAITVGASTKRDIMAYFSNYGGCVDIFAPGDHILSTWNSGDETRVLSGTSMASPHTAGVAALHISVKCSSDKDKEFLESDECLPKAIKTDMINAATLDTLGGIPKAGEPGQPKDDWPFPWPDPRGPSEPVGETKNTLLFVTDPDAEDAKNGEDKERRVPTKNVDGVKEEATQFHILPMTMKAEPVQAKMTIADAAMIRSRISGAVKNMQKNMKPKIVQAEKKVQEAMDGNILVKMVDAIFG